MCCTGRKIINVSKAQLLTFNAEPSIRHSRSRMLALALVDVGVTQDVVEEIHIDDNVYEDAKTDWLRCLSRKTFELMEINGRR